MMIVYGIPIWGWLDIVFTIMVLLGVCGESEWAAKLIIRDTQNDLVPIGPRIKRLKTFSETILILGLLGELLCVPLALVESARLNKEAGQARKEAEEAKAQNKASEVRITTLEVERNQIALQLEETRLGVAQAVLAAKTATNLVNNANVAIIQHLDRRLTAEQKYNLMKSLDSVPKAKIMFEINAMVPDVEGLMDDMGEVFTKAGFEFWLPMSNIHAPMPFITVCSSGETNLPAAVALSEGLSKMGFPTRAYPITPIGSVPRGVILIDIGKK